ncbi:MAG: putative membrane protein YfcA [Gammaproteobacteria bacterium]|jgi:uncharacterized membrane protein YfcA
MLAPKWSGGSKLFYQDLLSGQEPGMLLFAIVALVAGIIRGFTGFGGPAFILAILTLFYPPAAIVSKILIADFLSNIYLFHSCFKSIDWRSTAFLSVPSVLLIPLGQWLLIELDPLQMKQVISIIISGICILLLVGFRYRAMPGFYSLIAVGIIAGIVFGATYIALVTVCFILLGPYEKSAGRNLIISWAFFTVVGFAIISIAMGTVTMIDLTTALPGAASYLFGTWLGSRFFSNASEKLFRRSAIGLLFAIALMNLSQSI